MRTLRPIMLRDRIALLFALTALLFSSLVAGAAWVVIRSADTERQRDRLADQRLLWAKSVEVAGTSILVRATRLANDPEVLHLVTIGDAAALTAVLAERARQLPEAGNPVYRIDAVTPDEGLVASSDGPAATEPMVDPTGVMQALAGTHGVVGVEIGRGQHELIKVASAPLPDGRGFIAVAGVFGPSVMELAKALEAAVFVVDRDGRMVKASAPDDWPTVRDAGVSLDSAGVVRIARHGHDFDLISSPVEDSAGNPIATVLALRDVTAESERRALLLWLTGAAGLFLLVLLLHGLYGYLRGALWRLGEIAHAVRALSRGDTMVSIELTGQDDEVGQITASVEVFRRDRVLLDRLDFQARLERAQQESLIRREMTALANTLDPADRADVLNDLARLQAESGGESESAARLLAEAFQGMTGRLVGAHRRLDGLLAERTRDLAVVREALEERTQLNRLREELDVARRLQLSSLPARFPAFPERTEFDLHAAMRPAKEVGGDFYDFVLVGPDRLALMIGDASGKGVSAALFIAMGRSLIRSAATRGATPAECLALANVTLCADNETMMFATAFVALLDLVTGDLVYANAGHNPPYIKRADGSVTTLNGSKGMALGVMEDETFADATARLLSGDTLLCFTDGVTEAISAEGALFTDPRLLDSLDDAASRSPEGVIRRIFAVLDAFAGTAEQADDITMVCLRYL